MPDRTEALDAIESLNDISLGKKPLVVKEAEERSSGSARPANTFTPRGNNNSSGGNSGFNNPRKRY
jgi:RNA recognition motif-containing protein